MACTEFDATLGLNLRRARDAAGLSQQELADRIGLSQNAISLYENGSRAMPAHLLQALVRELGIPVQFFFKDTPDESLTPEAKLQEIVTKVQSSREDVNLLYMFFNALRSKRKS